TAPDPDAFRRAMGDEASEIARIVPQLRRVFSDIGTPMELPPEQTRRALLSAIERVLSRVTTTRPILLLVDDLHWADEGTLSLLSHLALSIGKLPVMIVGIYRDHELNLRGPLGKMLDEFSRLRVMSHIDLGGLPETAVADIIRSLTGQDPPSRVGKIRLLLYG